ncbi:DASH family cryptochrome [Ferrimonas balearica]|uniref:DASH family cryptochrome n=1 Tax=Ferrimonas balearica TaxID=44012 RepID=UPI001C9A008D|nr:DASH family cryptochrome [Ferrimonas balearica]MBY5991725.1 DASH family cryptochrome [Ferrimonas balearica]
MKRTLFWFRQDLRLDDNPALLEAADGSDELLCLYCIDPAWFRPGRYQSRPVGARPWRFIRESLEDLAVALRGLGQQLVIRQGDPLSVIPTLLTRHGIERVVCTAPIGWQERQQWLALQTRHPEVRFEALQSFTLYELDRLPFALKDLPKTFSQFRKRVGHIPLRPRFPAARQLPPPPLDMASDPLPQARAPLNRDFQGGASAALVHLQHYFAGDAASRYKLTRNALDDWSSSTKFSPWLAQGCLSPRQVLSALDRYERHAGANESTDWIRFELLWREYFQWYALAHGVRLFAFTGVQRVRRPTAFYPERFARWTQGHTPYPIINAAMHQLDATGFLSNRARQLVASAFVHELGLDWRYGAAYFQERLLDHDVASNWGNWQYLAGVGADPRGWRRFDLARQSELYDPEGEYVTRWCGETVAPLDSLDGADWPVETTP